MVRHWHAACNARVTAGVRARDRAGRATGALERRMIDVRWSERTCIPREVERSPALSWGVLCARIRAAPLAMTLQANPQLGTPLFKLSLPDFLR